MSLVVLIMILIGTSDLRGQSPETWTVYKFSAEGIGDPVSAKPLQYLLMEQPTVMSCVFIDECDCFKLSTSAPIGYAVLTALLDASGHPLEGDVPVSDGTTLRPTGQAIAPR